MKLRIKYELSGVSNLESNVLIEKIADNLMYQGYLITERTDNIILFEDYNTFRSRGETFRKIDNGKFEIINSGYGASIKFTYYLSFLPEVIITTAIIILTVAIQDYRILIIDLPFLLQLVLRFYKLKAVGNAMIANLIK